MLGNSVKTAVTDFENRGAGPNHGTRDKFAGAPALAGIGLVFDVQSACFGRKGTSSEGQAIVICIVFARFFLLAASFHSPVQSLSCRGNKKIDFFQVE